MIKRFSWLLRWSIGLVALVAPSFAHAVDSYRFMHVTIETPWAIFLFLLVIVLIPFILSAILHWHFAGKKSTNDDEQPPT
jgi:hypothetical protein